MVYGRLRTASALHHLSAYVHQAVEECARRNDHTLGSKLHAPHRTHANGLAIFHDQLLGLVLPNVEKVDTVERLAPCGDELFTVALCPGTPHGRSLALVEHAKLEDRKSTRLNSSHANISYAVF